jgi:hypothetical protein
MVNRFQPEPQTKKQRNVFFLKYVIFFYLIGWVNRIHNQKSLKMILQMDL